MSKIRNLFKKFKKNKSDQDLDDIFYEDEVTESEDQEDPTNPSHQLDDFELDNENSEELDEDTLEEDALEEELEATPPAFDTLEESEDTGDIDIDIPEEEDISINLEEEVPDLPPPSEAAKAAMEPEHTEEEISEDWEESTSEIPFDKEELNAASPSVEESFEEDEEFEGFDEEEYEEEAEPSYTSEIDLENGELTFKDKAEHALMRVKDRFRRHGQKDLNEALKNDTPKKPSLLKNMNLNGLNSLKSKTSKVNWANIPTQFFNPENYSKYHRVFQVGTVLLVTVTTAKLIGNVLQGDENFKDGAKGKSISVDYDKVYTHNQLKDLKAANVFRTDVVKAKNPKAVKRDTEKVCNKANRNSSLPIKLINTIVLQDSVKSLASVQVRSSSKLESFRQGEKIGSMARLDKIDRLKLIVKNLKTDQCESIENKDFKRKTRTRSNAISVLSPKKSREFKKNLKPLDGIENNGNEFKIKKSFLKEKMANPGAFLTEARGIQINNPDGTISFKIVDVVPGGIFAYLGIQNNDVISEINGEPIKNFNEVMSLFGRVANLSNMNLTIKRGGEAVKQNYEIK